MKRTVNGFKALFLIGMSVFLVAGAAHGQTITGRVLTADAGDPLEGYFVNVFGPDWNRVGYTQADALGNYAITGDPDTGDPLPTGVELKLIARPPGPNLPYIEQHYNLKNPGETPDTLTLSEGQTASGIDFALERAPDNRVSGIVRDPLGTPIDTFNTQPLQVTIKSASLGGYSATIDVGANGAYTFQYLPPADDYQVSVWIEDLNGCEGSFIYSLDPGKTIGVDPPTASAIYYLQATPVPVDAAADYANIDIVLDENQPRRISGTVMSETDESPLSGFGISVWADDIEFSGWANTDVNGDYTVCGVPALDALVAAADPPNAQSLFYGEFYNDKQTYDSADRVSTTGGDLSNIDFFLSSAPANLVQGQVRDTAGDPLEGKNVFFYSESADFSKSTTTDAEGIYSMAGLEPANDYRISVYHNLEGTEYDFYYFDAARSVIVYEQAAPVAVTDTSELFSKNVIIGFQGGEITGTVFNADNEQTIPNIRVNAWSEGLQAGGEAMTDANGNYRIWGLQVPGNTSEHYVVGIQNSQFVDQFYNGAASADSATPIPTGGAGVDFFLETGNALSGKVFDETEAPVSGARVSAFSTAANYYNETTTNAEGTYFIGNLPPENDYVVSVRHPDHQSQWYNGKEREEDADPVDLTKANVTIDFFLSKGAVIKGTIFLDDETTPAPAGVSVEAFSPTTQTGAGADTRSDGTYEILGLNLDITDYIVTVYRPGRPVVYFKKAALDGIVHARQLASGISPSATEARDMVLPPGVNLSGTVAFNGQPVKGIRVEAAAFESIPDVGDVDYGWGEAITLGALADGANYVVTGLRPGTDLVPVNYTVAIYPQPELARFAMQTKTVSVGAGDVTGVDFALGQAPGRTLSGAVNGLASGSTAYVNAWSEEARSGNGVEIVGTGEPVSYEIASLIPAADYVVEFTSPDYPRLVYENKFGWMPPDEVDLADAGASGIDFDLPALNNLAAISGTITFPEGAQVGETVRVKAVSASTGAEREVEVSLSDGDLTESYTIPALLKADDYRASVRSRQYRFLYYDGAATENDATPVDISGESVGGVDFALGIGTTISGRVSMDNSGVPGVEVTAWSDSLGVGGYAQSGADGDYIIRGLETAPDYVVEVNAWRSGLGSFFYREGGTVRSELLAGRVSTEAGNRTGIDIAISQGTTISGTVRSTDGEGLKGIRVSAWSELQRAGNSAFTGDDGGYAIRGLPDSVYEVSVEPDWTTRFVGQTKPDIESGGAGVNFALTRKPGSHQLSGVITENDINGPVVAGVFIEFWAPDGTLAGWDVTDANGAWGINGMATGVYRATATPPATTDLAFREQENVVVNGDRSLDVFLGAGVRIAGTVKTSDGSPVKGAVVNAVSIDSGYWEETTTNSSGTFRFHNAPAAADMVLTASKSGYVPRETSGFDPNTAVQLILYPSGLIRGEVRDVDGAPLPDVPVVATSAARKRVPAFSGSTRTDEDGRYTVDGLRSTDDQGAPVADYIVGAAAFTRYDETGEPIRYLGAVQTGKRTGETVNLLLTRATDSAVEISGGVVNPAILGGDYVAVDLVAGGGASGRFEQHQVLGGSGGFRFRGLDPNVSYFLGFGVYAGGSQTPVAYQWAGPTGALSDDPVSHQPPAAASVFSAGASNIGFQFDPNLKRRRRSDTAGAGTVKNLRIDVSGLTHTGDPSVLQARSAPQDLSRTPSAAVSNTPTVTVTWLPSGDGADELYYYIFNQDGDHQITKRNAPMPSVTARKATSRDLSGDYNQHHFHIAAEDDRGRIGGTSSLSFIIDTVAPRNVNVRANADTKAQNTSVVTLELGATGATEVYLSNTSFGEGGQWETYETTKQWAVSGDEDSAAIYIQFRDEAKNTANALVDVDLENALGDAVATLQVLVGIFADGLDADENGKVELRDAVHALQIVSGIRN